MYIYYFLIFSSLLIFNLLSYTCAKTITTTTPVYNNSYESQIYGNDLSVIENRIFGRTYKNESVSSRLVRIERSIYGNIHANLDYSQRLNNILADYNNSYNRNYLSDYNRNSGSAVSKIFKNFIGVPTGFTPPVMNMPFNDYGYPAGINRSYSSLRGYGFNNNIPANMGAGIHILD